MATQYERAPITEALIDIRINPLAGSYLDRIEEMYELVKHQYPEKGQLMEFHAEISIGSSIGGQKPLGFMFKSKDSKQILQARLDGFTFSRLRPYTNWRDLIEQTSALWKHYRAVIGSETITRVAVRYVNQIDIPLEVFDYKDYFSTTPEISPTLPQQLTKFMMQLQLPQTDFDGTLILTQTTTPPPGPGTTSVILDLDVFKENPRLSSDDDIWRLLEVLRDRKNQFFEGSITDRTRALFGPRSEV